MRVGEDVRVNSSDLLEPTRPRLGLEVLIVLAISLGQSGVYSVLRIIERMTRGVQLNQQTSTLNSSVTPDRPWLDLAYQLVGIAFALVPALLVLYLLSLTDRPATRRIGFDLTRPGFDAWFGTVIAACIGIPGLGLYLGRQGARGEHPGAGIGSHRPLVDHPGAGAGRRQNAVLEEVVMIGYLFTRLGQLRWRIPAIVITSAVVRGLLSPLPGLGRVRRQPDHGRGVRADLPALEAGDAAGGGAHAAGRGGVRGLRAAGPARRVAQAHEREDDVPGVRRSDERRQRSSGAKSD